MCGIVGYVGTQDPTPILLGALSRMEYRGYDSAGVALQNGRGIVVRKLAGRVGNLRDELDGAPVAATSGIGHTRWATHGAPTSTNAHPHTDCSGTIALVHNGIIENADVLRQHLERKGHTFETDTDTEALAHLIEDADGGTLEERVATALERVEGTYGVAVMSSAEPGTIVVARRGSPVLLGLGDEGELFVASDPAAVLAHTRSVVYLEDGDVAVLRPEGYHIADGNGRHHDRRLDTIDWDLQAIELGGYPHFMLKEIFEQPTAITNTLRGRLQPQDGTARLDGLKLSSEAIRRIRRIVIVACGTSWHAGLVGRHLIEQIAGIPVQVEYASEFRYQKMLGVADALVVAISQSGETADTLEALRVAQAAGARAVSLVNVVGSTIARESSGGVYLHAGPEIGVASTKAFTCQLAAILLLAIRLGREGRLRAAEGRALAEDLHELPAKVAEALALDSRIQEIALDYRDGAHCLYLGRGVNFPVALEGALKLKEVSYIHAEGYPAAEMKHGPIALIDEQMPVVVVAPRDELYTKTLSNVQEVKARGGRVIMITTPGPGDLTGIADHVLEVPRTNPLLSPLVTVVPLQLLAYHMAVLRGCDVDRPRNLAKSVTVE